MLGKFSQYLRRIGEPAITLQMIMNKFTWALLIDLDGTLVDRDILDELCGLVGKGEKGRLLASSISINALTERINLLQGMPISDIHRTIEKDPRLDPGSKALTDWARSQNAAIIINSGNITPVLEKYSEILGIDYIVSSPVRIVKDRIDGVAIVDYPCAEFKLHGCKIILDVLGIPFTRTVAIGDSLADVPVFKCSGFQRTIIKCPNDKNRDILSSYSNYFVNDLIEAKKIAEQIVRLF